MTAAPDRPLSYRLLLCVLAALLLPMACSKASAAVDDGFKEGMAYADLREQLLANGWLPLRTPNCWTNVGGEADVCNVLPEVESCGGSGVCVMNFAHKESGSIMRVGAEGDYTRWNNEAEKSAFTVGFWETQSVPTAPSAACPTTGFSDFLIQYANNDAAKKSFTDPLVKVIEPDAKSEEFGTVDVYMAGTAYAGFNLRHQKDGFHVVDYQGSVDPMPTDVDIDTSENNVRIVSYRYGMSEGNAYRFELRDGCWHMTESPYEPSP
ncbi:hypothetical protein [Leminorella grimontii]|uniref:hypothetical protein n=1 Tax=Leminorella grimontii TaxID=82981 RepID=UPI0032209E8F